MKPDATARSTTREGVVEVRRTNTRTLSTVMSGYITGALVTRNEPSFLEQLQRGKTPFWYFDLMTITGFDAAAVPAGVKWWSAFKAQGGTHVIFVTEYGAARMAAAAIGFSVGVKILVCTTAAEAQTELAKLLALPS